MKKRTFSAELKAKIVLEVLKGEKEISVIASENEVAIGAYCVCSLLLLLYKSLINEEGIGR